MCHLLLILPILALAAFWVWPLAIAAPVYAAVLVISLLFYTLLIKSMRTPVRTGREDMLHSTGIVLRPAGPRAVWIRVHGEEWKAHSGAYSLRPGDTVRIVGMDGMTLHVVPEPADDASVA